MTPLGVELHTLIQSMNDREKRFFYLSLARDARGYHESFLELFDLLWSKKEYVEPEVKDEITNQEFLLKYGKRLADLYVLVLKSLADLHGPKKLTSMLKYYINEAEILFDRGLYDQSNRKLQEARGIAETFENHNYLQEVLALEKRLWRFLRSPTKDAAAQMLRIFQEEQEIIKNRKLVFELNAYRDKLRALKEMQGRLRTEGGREEVGSLMKNMKDFNPEVMSSFWQKMAYYEVFALAGQLTGDIQQAYIYWEKAIIQWHLNPIKVSTFKDEYARMLSEFMLSALIFRKNIDFLSMMVRLKTQQGEFPHDKQHMELLLSVLKLGFHLYKGNLHFCEQLVPALETLMAQKEAAYHDPYYELQLWHYLQIFHFLMGHHEAAYAWGERMIEYRQSEYGVSLQDFARLINLLVLYEQARLEELGQAASVFETYLQQVGRYTAFEGLVISMCQDMAVLETEEEERSLLSSFKEQLTTQTTTELHTYSMEYNVLVAYVNMRLKATDIGTEYYYMLKANPRTELAHSV